MTFPVHENHPNFRPTGQQRAEEACGWWGVELDRLAASIENVIVTRWNAIAWQYIEAGAESPTFGDRMRADIRECLAEIILERTTASLRRQADA